MKKHFLNFVPLLLTLLVSEAMQGQCPACQHAVDVVTNGSFTGGNNGFSSDLDYVTGIFTCPLCPENTYTIGANAVLYHSGFQGSDHTNPPFGNFFIANGQGLAGSFVWCETVDVQPYTDYTFTFWTQDVANNADDHPLAQLQVSFNGALGNDTIASDGDWTAYTTTWNSGSASSLDLCIINQQSQTGGNDFGLDDISLVGCHAYHLSQQAYAGQDQVICSQEVAQLGQPSITGYTYVWDNPAGLSSAVISNPQLQVVNTGPGDVNQTYVLTTDSAGVGCITTDTVMVTVHPMPEFSLGTDVTICPGATTILNTGTGWDTILWWNSADTETIEVPPGTYFASVAFEYCISTDSITVFEEDMPIIDLGPDQEICETEVLVLDAGVVGTWSDNTSSQTYEVLTSGNYQFTYSQGSCFASDEVNIQIFSMPIVVLPVDTVFCQGSGLVLEAGVEGLWSTGETASAITTVAPGYYYINVENGPCVATAGTDVQMTLLPFGGLPSDTLVCDGTVIRLDSFAEQNDHYTWSTGDTTAYASLVEPGEYTVEVSNECGTAGDSFVLETYLCDWAIFVPNTFTPNDDPYNQGWMVSGYNVSNVKITVYNRLGNEVFYANGIGQSWTPSAGVGDDVYNYRIEAISYDGQNIEQYGHIYLLR